MMIRIAAAPSSASPDLQTWLPDAESARDVVAILKEQLSAAWDVARMVNPDGETSVVVMPSGTDDSVPTFILFEADGLVQTASVRDDVWTCGPRFRDCLRAVRHVIAMADLQPAADGALQLQLNADRDVV